MPILLSGEFLSVNFLSYVNNYIEDNIMVLHRIGENLIPQNISINAMVVGLGKFLSSEIFLLYSNTTILIVKFH